MKKTDYHNKDSKELNRILGEKREALRNFRFSLSGSKIRNVKEGRAIRKEVARILTEINGQKLKVTLPTIGAGSSRT